MEEIHTHTCTLQSNVESYISLKEHSESHKRKMTHYVQGKSNKISPWKQIRPEDKVQNIKNHQLRILYPAKLSFKNECKIEIFPDKLKLKQLIGSRRPFPKIWRKFFRLKGNDIWQLNLTDKTKSASEGNCINNYKRQYNCLFLLLYTPGWFSFIFYFF